MNAAETSLPPWITPGYYANADPAYLHEKSPQCYQLAFNTSRRNGKTAEDFREERHRFAKLRADREEEAHLSLAAQRNKPKIYSDDNGHESPFNRQSAKGKMTLPNPDTATSTSRKIILGPQSVNHRNPDDLPESNITKHVVNRPHRIGNAATYLDEDTLAAKLTRIEITSYDPWKKDYILDALPKQSRPNSIQRSRPATQQEPFQRDSDSDFYGNDIMSLASLQSQSEDNSIFESEVNSRDSRSSLSLKFTKPRINADDYSERDANATSKQPMPKITKGTIIEHKRGVTIAESRSHSATSPGENSSHRILKVESAPALGFVRSPIKSIPHNIEPAFPKSVTHDIGPALTKWYEDNEIYMPEYPKSKTRWNNAYDPPPVNLHGLLLPHDDYMAVIKDNSTDYMI